MADYKFCPLCAQPLIDFYHDHRLRKKCSACGFIHYHNPVPAAGCVIFRQGCLLMVQRAHFPYVGDWTIPAGFCEWDENPADTAVRELAEETGLQVEVGDLFRVYNGDDDPRTNAILILYFARIVGGELRAADDALQARFFSRSEIPANIAFASHRQAVQTLKTEYAELFEADAN